MTTPDAIVVLVTAPPVLAATLARAIIDARLAACVASSPIRSVYRWDGAIEDNEEVQLVVKTTRTRFAALEAFIREHHEYEVPEILALPVLDGNTAYLAWLRSETEPR